jgi:hypothetical protein
LSTAKEGKLAALERKNMKTIEEVYQRLREDDTWFRCGLRR